MHISLLRLKQKTTWSRGNSLIVTYIEAKWCINSFVETQIIQLPSIAYVPFDTSQLSTSFYQLGSQEYWWLLNVPYVFNIVLDIEEFKIQSSTAECVENNSLKVWHLYLAYE